MQTPTDAPQHPQLAGHGEGAGVRKLHNGKPDRVVDTWLAYPLEVRQAFRDGFSDGLAGAAPSRQYESARSNRQIAYENGRQIGALANSYGVRSVQWTDIDRQPYEFVAATRQMWSQGLFVFRRAAP